MVCRLLVPFNLVERGGRVYGLDAYFWGVVEDVYRPLLVFPGDQLAGGGEGVRLEPRVGVWGQLRDLGRLAEALRLEGGGGPGLRGWLRRILHLFVPVPGRVLDGLARSHVRVLEVEIAARIAGEFADARPLGRLGYAILEVSVRGMGRLVLQGSGYASRIYGRLLEDSAGFRRELYRVVSLCRRGDRQAGGGSPSGGQTGSSTL